MPSRRYKAPTIKRFTTRVGVIASTLVRKTVLYDIIKKRNMLKKWKKMFKFASKFHISPYDIESHIYIRISYQLPWGITPFSHAICVERLEWRNQFFFPPPSLDFVECNAESNAFLRARYVYLKRSWVGNVEKIYFVTLGHNFLQIPLLKTHLKIPLLI